MMMLPLPGAVSIGMPPVSISSTLGASYGFGCFTLISLLDVIEARRGV